MPGGTYEATSRFRMGGASTRSAAGCWTRREGRWQMSGCTWIRRLATHGQMVGRTAPVRSALRFRRTAVIASLSIWLRAALSTLPVAARRRIMFERRWFALRVEMSALAISGFRRGFATGELSRVASRPGHRARRELVVQARSTGRGGGARCARQPPPAERCRRVWRRWRGRASTSGRGRRRPSRQHRILLSAGCHAPRLHPLTAPLRQTPALCATSATRWGGGR